VVDGLGFIHELCREETRELASSIGRAVVLAEAPDNGTLATFLTRRAERGPEATP